jgi:hypothetical protein
VRDDAVLRAELRELPRQARRDILQSVAAGRRVHDPTNAPIARSAQANLLKSGAGFSRSRNRGWSAAAVIGWPLSLVFEIVVRVSTGGLPGWFAFAAFIGDHRRQGRARPSHRAVMKLVPRRWRSMPRSGR